MDKTQKLKKIILAKYNSVREFAKIIDIPSSTLNSALEKGIGGMAVDRVIKICDELNIDVKTFDPIHQENVKILELKDLIKLKREELNLTLEELGNLVGVGKSTVRKWETGQIENMRRDNIVALSKSLNISPSVLMGWDDIPIDNDNTTNKLSNEEQYLLDSFNKLNDLGKNEAVKRVDELTLIDTYTKNETENKVKKIPFRLKDHLTEHGNIETIAAHNDHTNEPGEIEKIMEDIEDMKNW